MGGDQVQYRLHLLGYQSAIVQIVSERQEMLENRVAGRAAVDAIEEAGEHQLQLGARGVFLEQRVQEGAGQGGAEVEAEYRDPDPAQRDVAGAFDFIEVFAKACQCTFEAGVGAGLHQRAGDGAVAQRRPAF
ncbi:hypothetical protein D3C78_755860 [compost metagenome]